MKLQAYMIVETQPNKRQVLVNRVTSLCNPAIFTDIEAARSLMEVMDSARGQSSHREDGWKSKFEIVILKGQSK